jgi:hypothetical protein
MPEMSPDGLRIDVSQLVQRSVASLHAHLVTRPTGRAVRLAIETQLAEVGDPTVSLVDLSDVSILDFSCADEVVAKLLQRYLPEDRPRNAFFVFRGVQARHRDPMEIVLRRQSLAAVAQGDDGEFMLVGERSPAEDHAWQALESASQLSETHLHDEGDDTVLARGLQRLLARRLLFQDPTRGDVYSLGHLVRRLENRA